MSIPTKKTITSWVDNVKHPASNKVIRKEFEKFINDMFESKKTFSKTPEIIDDMIFERRWLDEAAADEWISFLDSMATNYNFTHVTTKHDIDDI